MSWTRTRYGDPLKAAQEGVEKANLEIGAEIAANAKLLCAVDTGQNRNSLSVSSLKTSRLLNNGPGEQAEAIDTRGLKNAEVFVGSNSDHFIFPEFGTKKQVAQPALRPAKEKVINGSTDQEIIKRYGRAAMEEEFKRRV